ncbi:MAG TPA: cytochrome c peroxidase [Anaerolineales bacterium]|nr:cytochrome c peroxidase [Anaerolineales bacterium]
MRKALYIVMVLALVTGFSLAWQQSSALAEDAEPGDMAALGKAIFFDEGLSINGTQSCATCHAPELGFTGPDSLINAGGAVYEGALPGHYGNRKPPASAYAGDSPLFHYDEVEGGWFGGMFWDGRATGATLFDPLAEQGQGPFLNPLEQAVANAQVLCVKVKKADYAGLFEEVWGAGSLDCAKDVNGVYERIGRSVAAYERSAEVNSFTSKFDLFWDNAAKAVPPKDITKIKCGMGGGGGGMGGAMGCPGSGMYGWASYRNLGLTDVELQGLAIFNDPNRANCASCHTLTAGPDGYPLFTDFGYDNIGMPMNPDNPFYSMPAAWNPDGANWVDYGLGGYLKGAGYAPDVYEPEMGKFKVPTLRNVDLRPSTDFVKAYGHNGYFKSLEDLVFFYHWRAMMDNGCMGGGMGGGGMGGGMGCEGMASMFPPPEVDQNRAELGMFPRPQVDNIVLFLKTLSDGYFQR